MGMGISKIQCSSRANENIQLPSVVRGANSSSGNVMRGRILLSRVAVLLARCLDAQRKCNFFIFLSKSFPLHISTQLESEGGGNRILCQPGYLDHL